MAVDKKRETVFLKLLAIISGAITLLLASYAIVGYASGADTIVGDNLVNTSTGAPLEFPPPSISPIYIKPVTVLYGSTTVFIVSLMSAIEGLLMRSDRLYLSLGFVVFFLAASLCFYEVIFNFSLWDAIMVQQIQSTGRLNPDVATNVYPVGKYAINLAFATKVFTAALISLSFITFMFWRALSKKKDLQL